MLCEVSRVLLANVRSSDAVSRIGGDEFAIILQDIEPDSLKSRLSAFCTHYDSEVSQVMSPALGSDVCRLSIGCESLDIAKFTDADSALQAADRCMYRAKERKGDCSQFEMDSSCFD